jgi:hypothetical protein
MTMIQRICETVKRGAKIHIGCKVREKAPVCGRPGDIFLEKMAFELGLKI